MIGLRLTAVKACGGNPECEDLRHRKLLIIPEIRPVLHCKKRGPNARDSIVVVRTFVVLVVLVIVAPVAVVIIGLANRDDLLVAGSAARGGSGIAPNLAD
jgi:hypothetical protein